MVILLYYKRMSPQAIPPISVLLYSHAMQNTPFSQDVTMAEAPTVESTGAGTAEADTGSGCVDF